MAIPFSSLPHISRSLNGDELIPAVTTDSYSLTNVIITPNDLLGFVSSSGIINNSFTSSYLTTSSFNNISASFETTNSFNEFSQSVIRTYIPNSVSESFALESDLLFISSSVASTNTSQSSQIESLTSVTSSYLSTSSFNNFTSSVEGLNNFNSFTQSYQIDSASFSSSISNNGSQISALEIATSSYVKNIQTSSFETTSSFNSYTQSVNSTFVPNNATSSMTVATASVALNILTPNNSFTSSYLTTSSFNSLSSSFATVTALSLVSSSNASFDTTQSILIQSLTNPTSSYVTTSSFNSSTSSMTVLSASYSKTSFNIPFLGAGVSSSLIVGANTLGGIQTYGFTTKQAIAFTRAYTGGFWQGSPGNSQKTNGIITGQTYRLQHYCTANCSNLQLLFGNSQFDVPNTNDINVKSSIEDSNGNVFPVYFNGQRQVTIRPGGFVKSDILGARFASGSYIWSRTYVSSISGGTWYLGNVSQFSGEGPVFGSSDQTDYVDFSGSLGSTGVGYVYCPLAIYGDVVPNTIQVALIGDSISQGRAVSPAPLYDNPWGILALGPNLGSNYSHITVAQDGEGLGSFVNPVQSSFRTMLMRGSTHVIVQYALVHINTTSLSIAQAQLISLWTQLVQMGLKVYMCTVTPYTTSTDGWITTINQTPVNSGNETIRTQLNDWIRTTPYPLTTYYEIADTLESSRNSGIWNAPGYTGDGLHPNTSTANIAMAAAIDTTKF